MLLRYAERMNAKYVLKIMYFVHVHASDLREKPKEAVSVSLTGGDVPSIWVLS